IDSLLFNGANSRVLVRTGSGELIESDVTVTGNNDLKPGEDVRLIWSSRQAMCFARAESA
ncbi:TOBE domain-containing protein, partial [Salinisphaera sp. USBA-960]|nr:TOBE domain-containing protein [Salifodinibacter halophilus]